MKKDEQLDHAINSSKTRMPVILGGLLFAGFLLTTSIGYLISRHSIRASILQNELPLSSNNIYSEIRETFSSQSSFPLSWQTTRSSKTGSSRRTGSRGDHPVPGSYSGKIRYHHLSRLRGLTKILQRQADSKGHKRDIRRRCLVFSRSTDEAGLRDQSWILTSPITTR